VAVSTKWFASAALFAVTTQVPGVVAEIVFDAVLLAKAQPVADPSATVYVIAPVPEPDAGLVMVMALE
jgi:hypothetical protein